VERLERVKRLKTTSGFAAGRCYFLPNAVVKEASIRSPEEILPLIHPVANNQYEILIPDPKVSQDLTGGLLPGQ